MQPSLKSFDITGLPHPFAATRCEFTLPAGSSLDDVMVELVRRTGCQPALLREATVMVGDQRIPMAYWSHVRVKAGTPVIVRAVPGRNVLSVLVVVATLVAAFYIPGAIGLTGFAAKLASAAITVGGSLVAQAIAPGPQLPYSGGGQQLPSPSFSIAGTRNEARPYGVIPKLYGRIVNYHPPLAALPYTEVQSGNRQWLRLLFAVSWGPVDMSVLRIGTTPIDQFPDVSYQIDVGIGVSGLGLYPREVREESLSIQLRQVDGYIERTTPIDTDEIQLDITFPSGLILITNRNVQMALNVRFEVQYRPAAGGAWQAAPLASGFTAAAKLEGGGVFQVAGATKSARRSSVGFNVPRGRYRVRIRRLTEDDQSDNEGKDQWITVEDSYWSSLKSFQNEPPVTKPGIALVALRVLASDRLNGIIDTFNLTVEPRLRTRSGSSWTSPVGTRNPAWIFCDILTGPQNARALPASRLDLTAIAAWAADCDANEYTCDAVLNYRTSVWQLLQDVASCGRASPAILDGQYTVVQDKPRTTVIQHFSPRNMRNFEVSRVFADQPHALKIRFPDVRTEHQTAERIVYDSGYHAGNATKFEVLDLPYTTDHRLAWKFGRFALAATRLRPEIMSGETDIEHLACTRGDLALVSYDVIRVGLGSAYITAVEISGTDVTAITVELPMAMAVDQNYGVRLRMATSSGTVSVVHAIDTVVGEHTELTFTTPIPDSTHQPSVGDLVLFGLIGAESSEQLVRSIEPRADLSARVTFVAHAPEIHDADQGTIPEFDPGMTLPPVIDRAAPPAPIVTSIDSGENALAISNTGVVQANILLGIQVNRNDATTPAVYLQIQYRRADTNDPYTTAPLYPADTTQVRIGPVTEGLTYTIHLRTISALGQTSAGVDHTVTVEGQSGLPPDINHVFREGDYLSWEYPDPPLDFGGFRVTANYGSSVNRATARALHSGLLSVSKFDISSLSGTQTLMVFAVDLAGNESLNPAIVTINLGDLPVSNIILTQDEHPTFAGTIAGGTVVSSELVADIDSDPLFWGPDSSLFWGADGDAFWPTVTYTELAYAAAYDPDSTHLGATVRLAFDITGDYAVDYREVDSPLFWGSDGDLFWGADDDLFWPESIVSDWFTWPGQLGPLDDDSTGYEFRATVAAGDVQGTLTEMSVLIDVPDIVEDIQDFTAADTGTVRLPITATYRVIKTVTFTVQNAGGARTIDLLDKDPALGPSFHVLDGSGSRVSEVVDGVIRGY